MRTILHDWSDERATEVLRNTRAAIGTSLEASSAEACSLQPSTCTASAAYTGSRAASAISGVGACAGTSNATLALLELAPADGLRERFEGFVYMDVQMLIVCDGMERSAVRIWC